MTAVALRTMARPYAQAAFQFALEHNKVDQWLHFLQNAAQLVSHPEVVSLIDYPETDSDELLNSFYSILEKGFLDEKTKDFLKILSARHRWSLLPDMVVLFKELKAEHENLLEVDVTSAFELTEEQKTELVHKLEKRFKQKIHGRYHVDRKLLGGATIRSSHWFIDGSGRTKLQELKRVISDEL